MRIIIQREKFLDVLKRTNCVINPRPTTPILNNVLLSAHGDKLKITAMDNDMTIITSTGALIEEEGDTTLPSKILMQIVGAFPQGDITLETDQDDEAKLTCRNSFYKIHGLPASDYPEVSEQESDWEFSMPTRELMRGLAKVTYARSTDESRKQLNGVVLSIRKGLTTLAATDGRRLALQENQQQEEVSNEGDYILAAKVSTDLAKCMDDSSDKVRVRVNGSYAVFETESTTLMTRLVEGIYPNFRQVIPANCGNTVSVPRTQLIDVISRVSLIIQGTSNPIRMTFKENSMVISASNAEAGESKESIEVAYEGEEITVSFNHAYILEPLKIMESDNVSLEFGKQFAPLKITGEEGFLYMLMPMRSN